MDTHVALMENEAEGFICLIKVANSQIQTHKLTFRVLIAGRVAEKSIEVRVFIFPESGKPSALKIESFCS